MSHNIGVLSLKASRMLWYLSAVLIPLVMFPWTTDQFDFNKALVLVILASGIVLTSLTGMALTRSLHVKAHIAMVLPLLFLVIAALSGAFSLSQPMSFLGEAGQEHASLVMQFFAYVLFVIGAVFFEDQVMQKSMTKALLTGSAFVGVLTLLTFFGFNVGPFQNTVGVPSALAVYLLVMTVFGLGSLFTERKGGLSENMYTLAVFGITAATSFFVLIALDTLTVWILAIIAFLAMFTFIFARPNYLQKTGLVGISGLFLVVSLVFLFIPSPLHGRYPLEVSLNAKSSLSVAGQTLRAHPFLGSGPGTFVLDYDLYAPAGLNGSLFWNTNFGSAMSEFFTMLATHGILGVLALLLTPVALLGLALKKVMASEDDWSELFPALIAAVTLFAAYFLFASTMTTLFLIAVFASWVAAKALPSSKAVSHAHAPRLALVSSFGALLGSVGVLIIFFITLSRYGAEVAFAKAVARDREGGQPKDIITLLNTAATMNPRNDSYLRNLANALLLQGGTLAQDKNADPKEIQAYLANSVNAAVGATNVGPNNVDNWEILGTVYREISSVQQDANGMALAAYSRAITLAPSNPLYYVELARTYIVRSDLLNPLAQGKNTDDAKKAKDAQDDALKNADAALSKAIALKSDYAAARYYAAFVAERKNDLAGAVSDMEIARALSSKDIGVSIQLSLLYLRQGKNDLAEKELLRATDLDPKNENVQWYLSVAYEAEGKKDKAIAILQDLVKTNPDNDTVKERLDKLQKNQTPPPIPEPIEPTPTPADGTSSTPATGTTTP